MTPPPLEAILVIFGRRALIFFCFVWKVLEKYEKWHHFCAHAQWWSPWRRKNVEKRHLAPLNLTFFINCNRQKRFLQNERRRADLQNVASDFAWGLRACSFCAVFLFRCMNRNRNKRVQKEQFSSERNNFHGNKMAHSLISNRKGKKYEKIIRERSSKNTGGYFDKLLVFADRVFFFVLSRQSSNLSSWIPSGNGELLLFWQASFSKGKWWERCGTLEEEEEFVVLSVAAVVLRWKRAPKRLFSDLSRR